MTKEKTKMPLPKLDDLFTIQQERDEAYLEKVNNLPLNKIHDFPGHPFKVLINDEMYEMVDSIKKYGVLVPTLVRPLSNGEFEMISGHRRKKASELANNETLPCIIRNLTDDEATIIMVDSNMQREHLLPSEKAFAYKMKLEAMKRQGFRNDLTSDQVGEKLTSVDKLAKDSPDSKSQIQRYIRLTKLIKPLLNMVDNDEIGFGPAVEISFITKTEQKWLLDSIESNLSTPSLSQAQELKRLSLDGKLSKEKLNEILSQEKPNQVEKLKLEIRSLKNKIPRTIMTTQYKEYIFKALDYYNKYLQRLKDKER
ncbi:MAG: ParB/RepB/Spo0J family partition protein [Candidatus Aphodocola sp.]